MKQELRTTAIPVVGQVSWGTHLCQIYHTRADLLDILLPFFRAGLESNEYCLWLTASPLTVSDAKKEMERALPDREVPLRHSRVEVIDARAWYSPSGAFDAAQVLRRLSEKQHKVMAYGFAGLRVGGIMNWPGRSDWTSLTRYEEQAHGLITNARMIALCAYPDSGCAAANLIDLAHTHHQVLFRKNGAWDTLQKGGAVQSAPPRQVSLPGLSIALREAPRDIPEVTMHTRQTEYWTSRQIEEFFFDAEFEVVTFPLAHYGERVIPSDYLSYDRRLTKLFGLHYQTLNRNGKYYWDIEPEHQAALRRFPWLYYCFSRLKGPLQYRSALHLMQIMSTDNEFPRRLYPDGESRVSAYWRWGAFYQGLANCTRGVLVTSPEHLHHLLLAQDAATMRQELLCLCADIFLVDFASKHVVHLSPWLK